MARTINCPVSPLRSHCQLHIHLRQGFLHPLNATRRGLHMFGSLSPIGPYDPDLAGGLKRVV
jgi:hypothetical protein